MKIKEELYENLAKSNMELLRKTTKRMHTKLGKKVEKSVSELSMEILSTFKSIKSIFDTKEPQENEVCLIMFFNKNERFISLYKPLIDIFCSDLIKPKTELSKINLNGSKNKKGEENDYMDFDGFNFILKEILEEINKSNENLIDTVLDKYIELKPEKNFLLNNNETNNDNSIFYFEDFIFIFCSFIRYFTGFKIKLEISNDKDENIILFIYGEEDKYESIAEFFGFELQLKPYALKYEDYINRQNKSITLQKLTKKNQKQEKIELEENLIINKDIIESNYIKNPNTDLQFKDLDINNKLGFPPYIPFELNKKEKFRTYNRDDEYHFCEIDSDFCKNHNNKCLHDANVLRNIDKLRLIKLSLADIFHFNDLYQYGFLNSILYKRNLINYKKKESLNSISSIFLSLLKDHSLMEVINTFRNFYGEYVSYYFLWLVHLIHWIIFPIILGLILYALLLSNYIKKITVYNDNEIRIELKDIILLGFSGLIIIFSDLFQKTWIQKEKMFCYIWGMENVLDNETNNDFKSDQSIDFLFGTKIKVMKKRRFILRNIISYVILGIVIVIRIVSIHFLFSLQRKWNEEYQTRGKLGYAIVSGGISLIMTQIYKFLSRKLSYWENHKSLINQYNSLTFKVFLFEFFNNYATIFYIAFYKPYLDIIHYSNNVSEKFNYFSEIQIHLYVLLLINIGENLASFGMPMAYYLYQTKFKNNNKIIANDRNYTIKYQMSCFKYDNLLIEYMQKIILFGYINLFLVAVPLCPIFIVLILILEYLLDSYKLANFVYMMNIRGAKGIEVYNTIIKIISFIGIMSNGGLILFTKQYQDNNNTFRNFHFTELSGIMRSPIGIFALFENIILFFMSFISFNIQPKWFRHLEKYKSIYIEKYYNREKKKLPHLLNTSKKLS